MGISVRAKSGQNSSVHQFHRRRTATGVAHIGLRIVNDHSVRLLDQIHLMRIDVDAVAEQRLVSEHTVIHEPVYNPLSVMFQTVVKVFNPLCHVNVVSHFVRLVRRRKLKRLI